MLPFLENFLAGFLEELNPVKHFFLSIDKQLFHLDHKNGYLDEFMIILHRHINIFVKIMQVSERLD